MNGTRKPTQRWLIVGGMGLAVFLASLDMSVVNLALPEIRDSFGASTAMAQWVVLGYLLPLVALALPTGRWLDHGGHRAVLITACAGFAVSSVAAGLAQSIGWLIAARVCQGLFAAALMTLIPVLISTSVEAGVRGRAMGLVDTLGMLGLISGPAIGGLLVDSVGWPWIFYLNVPVCAALIYLAWRELPHDGRVALPDREAASEGGLLISAAAITMIALSLAAARAPSALWLFLGFMVIPLVMLWYRLPASVPVRKLVSAPAMRGPLAALAVTASATGVVFFIVPFHLITVLDVSASAAGLTMLAFPLAAALLAPAAGFLADRYGHRRIAFLGMVTLVCGLALLMPATPSWRAFDVAWRLVVAGIGIGLFNAPNMSAAMSASPEARLATTGAATSVARQGGFAFGPALATLVWGVSGYRPSGISGVFAAAAVVVVAGAYPLARSLSRPSVGIDELWSATLRRLWTARIRSRGLLTTRLRRMLAPHPGYTAAVAPVTSAAEKLRGREREERQIIQVFHSVAAETSAVIGLEGGWGSGRTRMLREAADAARRLGFTVVEGDWLPGAEPAALTDARKPVLVVLDDLHQADPAFVRSLRSLPRSLRDRPIVWLFSRRRGAGGPAADQLFADTHAAGAKMDLRPLPDHAVRLIANDYSQGTITGLPGFLRTAGGNALLTTELLRSLREGRMNGSGQPPQRIQDCVRRCLNELSDGGRLLLQVGAMLGVRFTLGDVAAMLGRPAGELLAPLDEVLAADILGCEGDRLVFEQELFRRSLLALLPPTAQQALRREAAAHEIGHEPATTHSAAHEPATRDTGRQATAHEPATRDAGPQATAHETRRSAVAGLNGDRSATG